MFLNLTLSFYTQFRPRMRCRLRGKSWTVNIESGYDIIDLDLLLSPRASFLVSVQSRLMTTLLAASNISMIPQLFSFAGIVICLSELLQWRQQLPWHCCSWTSRPSCIAGIERLMTAGFSLEEFFQLGEAQLFLGVFQLVAGQQRCQLQLANTAQQFNLLCRIQRLFVVMDIFLRRRRTRHRTVHPVPNSVYLF